MFDYFSHLIRCAHQSNHRYGLVLNGDSDWTNSTIDLVKSFYSCSDIVQLGGECKDLHTRYISYKNGKTLLGQECALLVCYLSDGFDANSFCAAMGGIRGGGLVLIVPSFNHVALLGQYWLNAVFSHLINIDQFKPLPKVEDAHLLSPTPFSDQTIAVEKIHKVSTGHRKRPFVMTADRGRGKSSALGIAAAQLMKQRQMRILVTAPSLATVAAVFEFAHKNLCGANAKKGQVYDSQSSLEFIAPDELLKSQPDCDLLLVDEASAIPVPMLKKMVAHYHRCVFSTTIHGYEGCGRGFTMKFQKWLEKNRPGTSFFHLKQPIRWAENDPLENWLFDAFLLNTELDSLQFSKGTEIKLEKVNKQDLVNQPSILRECFALLVNAHYQTTPSDLMLLLEEAAIQLYLALSNGSCVGCMMTIDEGGLDNGLIDAIQQGKRRPKGHLVPVTLANHFGISQAAHQHSTRIMRIATHPDAQRLGIGTEMISQFMQTFVGDYVSTSFGATKELIQFWAKVGFYPVRIGTQKDHVSGCYSVIMVKGDVDWLKCAVKCNYQSLHYMLSTLYSDIEVDIIRSLLVMDNASDGYKEYQAMIRYYSLGGSSFESVAPFLAHWILSDTSIAKKASDLLLRKVLQQKNWHECSKEFSIHGRKQLEHQIRTDIRRLLKAAEQ